jgi:tetratricopeptide (TPR) repeat protein
MIHSIFNPSTMPATTLEATFVQRADLAQRLSTLFGGLGPDTSTHNVLLVGSRGIGKSHLIALIHSRITGEDSAKRLAVAYPREDEWGIGSYLDLLVRVTDSVAEYLGVESPLANLALYKMSTEAAEEIVWKHLRQMVGTRPIVTIVENLNVIFAGLQDVGQRKWRALIQNTGQWAILASTPALFPQVSEQVSPFYGFFEVVHLPPLQLSDAVELMKRLALADGDPQTAEFVSSPVGRARIKAVQHLAGGNHRIFVVFYDFLRQENSQEFVAPLLKTIDALTPYYQSMMARLSPQQQKILNLLCDTARPANVTTVARRCLITHQTTASQLRQLLAQRYVRVNRTGREAYYELAEPLLRICVEVKSHRQGPLRLLVDFIRFWFSREELEEKIHRRNENEFGKDYLRQALSRYDKEDKHEHLDPQIFELCAFLSLHTAASPEVLSKAQELCELSRIAEDWQHFTIAHLRLGNASEVISVIGKQLEREPDNTTLLGCLARGYRFAGDDIQALKVLDRALEITPTSFALLLDKARILTRLNQPNSEIRAILEEAVRHDPTGVYARVQLAAAEIRGGDHEKALATLRDILEKGEIEPQIFATQGMALLGLDRNEEALSFLERATKDDPSALGMQAEALMRLDRLDEAIDVFDRILQYYPQHRWAVHTRCRILLNQGRYDVACETVPTEVVAHLIFHQLMKATRLDTVQSMQLTIADIVMASDRAEWKKAVYGGLVELASRFKEMDFKEYGDVILVTRDAIKLQFAESPEYKLLTDVFDVLVRMRTGDPLSILELPLEQRRLLVNESEEEELLAAKKTGVTEHRRPA